MNDKDVKEWLDLSEKDLKAGKYLIDGGFIENAAFYCQQSIEKSLKALFLKKFGKIEKSTRLSFLR